MWVTELYVEGEWPGKATEVAVKLDSQSTQSDGRYARELVNGPGTDRNPVAIYSDAPPWAICEPD